MNNDQHQQDQPKETTKQTMPGSPVQAGQQYETPEPKRRQPASPAEAKRAPQHEPGYEAKHRKEAQQEAHKRPASERSQADDSAAKIEADEDVENEKTQKANRTRTAHRKTDTKRSKPPRRHK